MNFYPYFAYFFNDSGEVQPRTPPHETAHVSHFPKMYVVEAIKAIPLQARSGPEGPRKLRFPDFVTTVQDGGRLSALRTGRLYPPGNTPGTHFC